MRKVLWFKFQVCMKNMLLETVGKVICLNGEKTVADVSSTTDWEIKLVNYFAPKKTSKQNIENMPPFFYFVATLEWKIVQLRIDLIIKYHFIQKSTQNRLKNEILRLNLEKILKRKISFRSTQTEITRVLFLYIVKEFEKENYVFEYNIDYNSHAFNLRPKRKANN